MNVIMVILDSLRKDHIGAYGNSKVKTPNFDAFARDSLRFERAYPESLPTIPARRSIHTGLRTWPFRNWVPQKGETFFPAGWQRIPEDQTTLSEFLLAEGYDTTLITDTQHQFKASMNFQRGYNIFDFIRGQERDRYKSILNVSPEQVERYTVEGNTEGMHAKVRQYLANTAFRKTEEDWFAPQVFTRAGNFLELGNEAQPFFLMIDSFDPHEPWDPPQKYIDLYHDGWDGPEPIVPNYMEADYLKEGELERMRALYAAEVTMVDHWFGNFMDKADSLGILDNTMVVLLADHGVALGEHGLTGKPAWGLYPELVDIPFMIRHPGGQAAGEASEYFASIHDLTPTILSSLGVEHEVEMDGVDLSVILEGGDPEPREHFTIGYDDYFWTRDERYILVGKNDGSGARLHDLTQDPEQNDNIAAGNMDVVQKMYNEYVLADAGGPLPRY